jgi:hypothetical protein
MTEEKDHEWIITNWVVNTADCKRPYKRICVKCGKTQKVRYLGGDMWKWVDSNRDVSEENSSEE